MIALVGKAAGKKGAGLEREQRDVLPNLQAGWHNCQIMEGMGVCVCVCLTQHQWGKEQSLSLSFSEYQPLQGKFQRNVFG